MYLYLTRSPRRIRFHKRIVLCYVKCVDATNIFWIYSSSLICNNGRRLLGAFCLCKRKISLYFTSHCVGWNNIQTVAAEVESKQIPYNNDTKGIRTREQYFSWIFSSNFSNTTQKVKIF